MSYRSSRGSLLWGGEKWSALQVAPNWQQCVMQKRFVIHIMSGVMKWIHFLASWSLRSQRTLCYQHRWSMRGSGEEPGANYKQATVNTNESLRVRPSLSNDSFGSSIKMSESQWSCPTKCTVKTLDGQFRNHANHRGLTAASLWGASNERHSSISCILFKVSRGNIDNLNWSKS